MIAVEASSGPVFIVGAPRSGTTLVQWMLRSHPAISIPSGESHFIVPLERMADTFGDLATIAGVTRLLEEMYRRRPYFLDRDLHGLRFDIPALARTLVEDRADSVAKIVRRIFGRNALGEGKTRWGDKTPPYTRHLPVIARMFPDARIVHVIRDPRDCVLSMLARSRDLAIHNTCVAAETWESFVAAGQRDGRALGPVMYRELVYERLLDDPEGELRVLCDFLGEPYSPLMLEYRRPQARGKTPLLGQGLTAGNAGKWRERMRPAQLAITEAVCGELMRANGYEPVMTRKPLSRGVRRWWHLHNRIAHRWKTPE